MISDWGNPGEPASQELEEVLVEMKDYENYLTALIREESRFGHNFSAHSKSLVDLRGAIKDTEAQLKALRDTLPMHIKGKGGEIIPGRSQPDNIDSAGRYSDAVFKVDI